MLPNGPTLGRRRLLGAAAAGLSVAVLGSGCGDATGGASGAERLRMMVPHSPGGGYDLTARAAAKALQDSGLTGSVEILNVLGGGGTVALQRLLNEQGAEDLLMTMGLGVVGAAYANRSPARPESATPVARLLEEQEGVLVPAGSPWRTVEDLVEAWRQAPGSVSVGGGSSLGGPDHLFGMQLAAEVGIEPREVSYTSFEGGGPLTMALLGEDVDVAMSSLGELEGQIREGALRVLAVSGQDRHAVDAPTLTESGIGLVFTNWRGVLAPPGLPDERLEELVELLTAMHATEEWQQALERNGWDDSFATGEEFARFLDQQATRVTRTLAELGLT